MGIQMENIDKTYIVHEIRVGCRPLFKFDHSNGEICIADSTAGQLFFVAKPRLFWHDKYAKNMMI